MLIRPMPAAGMISPNELARRWRTSRFGAVRIVETAWIPSVFLDEGPRSMPRFRLLDIRRYEESVTE